MCRRVHLIRISMKPSEQSRFKVLLIDDDRFLLEMYSLKLTQENFEVRAASSAKEALDVLKQFNADIIVFDIVMPEMSGLEFVSELRNGNIAPNAILVALTNQSSDDDKIKAEALGVDEYIVKATSIPSEVVNKITEAIKKHSGA